MLGEKPDEAASHEKQFQRSRTFRRKGDRKASREPEALCIGAHAPRTRKEKPPLKIGWERWIRDRLPIAVTLGSGGISTRCGNLDRLRDRSDRLQVGEEARVHR
jgi:hypothetical protein